MTDRDSLIEELEYTREIIKIKEDIHDLRTSTLKNALKEIVESNNECNKIIIINFCVLILENDCKSGTATYFNKFINKLVNKEIFNMKDSNNNISPDTYKEGINRLLGIKENNIIKHTKIVDDLLEKIKVDKEKIKSLSDKIENLKQNSSLSHKRKRID